MAVRVHLDFPLRSPFATGVTRVFKQVVIVILIVKGLLKGDESFHVCRHLDRGRSSFCAETGLGASKQMMMSLCLYTCGHVIKVLPLLTEEV